MKNIDQRYYDKRIKLELMRIFINKTLAFMLAVISLSAYAEDANNELSEPCSIKCSYQLNPKYVNGIEKVEVITEGNSSYVVKFIPNKAIFFAVDPHLAPGRYASSDPRIGRVSVEPKACGVYLNLISNTGDFIERLVPNSVSYNTQPTNNPRDLGRSYVIDDSAQSGYTYLGLYDKKPTLISLNDLKNKMNQKLEELKIAGICN